MLLVGGAPGGLAADALLAAFRGALDDMPLVALSRAPGLTQARHGIDAVAADSWRAVTRTIGRSRAVVFAGGAPFAAGRTVRMAAAIAAYARAAGRPVCLVGVTTEPVTDATSRALARALARHADLLVVRDDTAARALVDIGVRPPLRVGADPTWMVLDDTRLGPTEPTGEVLVVAPPAIAEHRVAEHVDVVRQAIGGTPVRVLDHCRDLPTLARELRGARLVVTGDFHATAAAAAAATRSLTVASDPATIALADRLGQSWVWGDASTLQLTTALYAALDGPAPARAAIRAEVAAAAEMFGLLRLVVTGGEMPADSISGLRLEPTW